MLKKACAFLVEFLQSVEKIRKAKTLDDLIWQHINNDQFLSMTAEVLQNGNFHYSKGWFETSQTLKDYRIHLYSIWKKQNKYSLISMGLNTIGILYKYDWNINQEENVKIQDNLIKLNQKEIFEKHIIQVRDFLNLYFARIEVETSRMLSYFYGREN